MVSITVEWVQMAAKHFVALTIVAMVALVLPWYHHGSNMVLPSYYHGTTRGKAVQRSVNIQCAA